MSESTNNNFYQPVEVSPGVTKNFIKNPEDAHTLADITENQGLKAAREAEKQMSAEPVSVLLDKINGLTSEIKNLSERNMEKMDIIDRLQVGENQNNATYYESIKAINNTLAPEIPIEGKRETTRKPEVPFEVSNDEQDKKIITEAGGGAFNDRTVTVKDKTTTFSSNLLVAGEKMATLKLTTHQFSGKMGGSQTIELSCKDNEGKILKNSNYSVTESHQAAQDYIDTYRFLDNSNKQNQ